VIFKPGDDVIVDFQGHQTPGEVVSVFGSGFVFTRIHIDPEMDYGEVSPRLDPVALVCVRETRVAHAAAPQFVATQAPTAITAA